MSDTSQLYRCRAVMDIAAVTELKHELQETMATTGGIELDGGEIERIDAAGLQLLCSFFREMSRLGTPPEWRAVSDVLRRSARLLGLTSHLGLDEEKD